MRAYRSAATVVVLLLALSAAGVLMLRRPIRPPTSHKHSFAKAVAVDVDGDDDAVGFDGVALKPAIERAPQVARTSQPQLLHAVRLPARDPIPVRHCKLPSDDDDPFARG